MNGRTPPTVFLLNGPAPVAEPYSLQPCQISAGNIRDAAWCGFEVQGESLVPYALQRCQAFVAESVLMVTSV
jgi:hypothetical protein